MNSKYVKIFGRLHIIAVSLIVIAICPFAVLSQTEKDKDQSKAIIGVVNNIDVQTKTLTVKNSEGQDLTFAVNNQTYIKGIRSTNSFADIKIGSSIGIRYLEKPDSDTREALVLRTDGEIPPPGEITYPPRKPRTNSPPQR